MQTPDLRWLLAATGPSHASQSLPLPWWQQALRAPGLPAWATLLAALVGFALLVSFQQVVAQSVVQGEQRRTATAAHERQLWLCKLLPGNASRAQCLAELRLAPESMPSHSVTAFVDIPLEN